MRALGWLLLAALIAGCPSTVERAPRSWDARTLLRDRLSAVRERKTTRGEMIARFGEPSAVETAEDGRTRLVWRHVGTAVFEEPALYCGEFQTQPLVERRQQEIRAVLDAQDRVDLLVVKNEPDPLPPGKERSFAVTETLEVSVPDGAQALRLWIASPSLTDPAQTVEGWRADAAAESRLVADASGNAFLFVEATELRPGPFRVVISFTVRRREVRVPTDGASRPLTADEQRILWPWLRPSEGISVDGRYKGLASRVAVGNEPLSQSRALFRWLLTQVEHWAKDEEGLASAGPGSADWALDRCTGGSSDFVALFASIGRAAGIPVRSVSGTLLPSALAGTRLDPERHEWAEVYIPDLGWLPVDAAVADLASDAGSTERRLPFEPDPAFGGGEDPPAAWFGGLDAHRVAWYRGRDLALAPSPAAEVEPLLEAAHVEIDGVAIPEGVGRPGWRRWLVYQEVVP